MVRKSNAMERKVGSAGESAHPEAKSLATKRYTLHKRLKMLQTGREAKPGRASKKRPRAPSSNYLRSTMLALAKVLATLPTAFRTKKVSSSPAAPVWVPIWLENDPAYFCCLTKKHTTQINMMDHTHGPHRKARKTKTAQAERPRSCASSN